MKEIETCVILNKMKSLLSIEWLLINSKRQQSTEKRINRDHKNKQLFLLFLERFYCSCFKY